MSRPRPPLQSVKPTLHTKFHIDLDWWEREDRDLRIAMQQICSEFEVELVENTETNNIDWVDPITACVTAVTPYTYSFLKLCSLQPDFITERTSLVEAVFRALLGAANRPMTPLELSERINRPPENILASLSGRRVYKGIRPVTPDS